MSEIINIGERKRTDKANIFPSSNIRGKQDSSSLEKRGRDRNSISE